MPSWLNFSGNFPRSWVVGSSRNLVATGYLNKSPQRMKTLKFVYNNQSSAVMILRKRRLALVSERPLLDDFNNNEIRLYNGYYCMN